jgi:hypothetical protein
MNLFLDILVCFLILTVLAGSRFNKWPAEQSALFDGQPADYIDVWRYRGFCLLYILTFFVITAILFSFPELLRFLPGTEEQQLPLSYTLCALIVVSALAHQGVSSYDETWRKQLHDWARIPRRVDEMCREIVMTDCFMPPDAYLQLLQQNLHRDDDPVSRWRGAVSLIEVEKQTHSIDWYFLKCATLKMIVEEVGIVPSADNHKSKSARIDELARLIPLASAFSKEMAGYQKELEDMSRFFIECVCKYLIKKYPGAEAQFSAFKNLGFHIRQYDVPDIHIREAIAWCLLGVVFVSVSSVIALLLILDAYSPINFMTVERFVGWSLGSIECFMIAILVGFLVRKLSVRKAQTGSYVYLSAFFLSTLASLIFFQFAQDLNQQSARLPHARFILAMSFAGLSIVVIKALSHVSVDRRDVMLSSLMHGFVLGVVMAFFQVAISIAFSWERVLADGDLMATIMREEWRFPLLALVGFYKGLFIGTGISFVIQETQRKQMMQTQRQNPRVERVLFMKCSSQGQAFSASTRDISKTGLKLQTRRTLKCGERLSIESPLFGNVEGVIKWRRRFLFGRQQIGIQFTQAPLRLVQFLRSRYGEYYA